MCEQDAHTNVPSHTARDMHDVMYSFVRAQREHERCIFFLVTDKYKVRNM